MMCIVIYIMQVSTILTTSHLKVCVIKICTVIWVKYGKMFEKATMSALEKCFHLIKNSNIVGFSVLKVILNIFHNKAWMKMNLYF